MPRTRRVPRLWEYADSAPGRTLLVGTPITWTYQVFNEGDAPIQISAISDDFGTSTNADDFAPAPVLAAGYNLGDTNQNELLDVGEVWRYTSAGTPAGGYLAVAGAYRNLATVTGTISGSGATVRDDDPANYFGTDDASVVSVPLEKAVNAVDPNAPTAAEDADNVTGPQLSVGSTVVWTYQVFNTGTVAVSVESLSDDAGTPTDGADDFTPEAWLEAGFNIGDTDRDNLLDVGETWLYRATGTVLAGQYTNIGRVTVADPNGLATASASDPANYLGIQPDVQLVKAVNAVNPLAPTPGEDANDSATPVVVPAGSTVVFTYAVGNPGGDALTSVTLLDDNGTPGNGADDFAPAAVTVKYKGKDYNTGDVDHDGLLDQGETWLFSAIGTVGAGPYTNVATVSGVNVRTNQTVMDEDPANVFGAVVGIDVEKAINAADPSQPTAAEDADDPSQPVVLYQGQSVTWTYLLSNTGNEALKNPS